MDRNGASTRATPGRERPGSARQTRPPPHGQPGRATSATSRTTPPRYATGHRRSWIASARSAGPHPPTAARSPAAAAAPLPPAPAPACPGRGLAGRTPRGGSTSGRRRPNRQFTLREPSRLAFSAERGADPTACVIDAIFLAPRSEAHSRAGLGTDPAPVDTRLAQRPDRGMARPAAGPPQPVCTTGCLFRAGAPAAHRCSTVHRRCERRHAQCQDCTP